jgi:hypothetical protein
MTYYSGSCLCQKVRYKISAAPISQGICYCRQCQKSGGMCGSPLMVFSTESFDCTQETLSFYKTMSDRGATVTRHFCSGCGSAIFSQIADIKAIVTVKASTLDNPGHFAPEYLVWTRHAGTSTPLPAGISSFSEGAPIEILLKGSSLL